MSGAFCANHTSERVQTARASRATATPITRSKVWNERVGRPSAAARTMRLPEWGAVRTTESPSGSSRGPSVLDGEKRTYTAARVQTGNCPGAPGGGGCAGAVMTAPRRATGEGVRHYQE